MFQRKNSRRLIVRLVAALGLVSLQCVMVQAQAVPVGFPQVDLSAVTRSFRPQPAVDINTYSAPDLADFEIRSAGFEPMSSYWMDRALDAAFNYFRNHHRSRLRFIKRSPQEPTIVNVPTLVVYYQGGVAHLRRAEVDVSRPFCRAHLRTGSHWPRPTAWTPRRGEYFNIYDVRLETLPQDAGPQQVLTMIHTDDNAPFSLIVCRADQIFTADQLFEALGFAPHFERTSTGL